MARTTTVMRVVCVSWVTCCILFISNIAFSESLQSAGHCSSDTLREEEEGLIELTLEEIGEYVYNKCMLLALHPVEIETRSILSQLYSVFQNDSNILIGYLNVNVTNIHWNTAPRDNTLQPQFAFYARKKRDRSCLLLPPTTDFIAEPYIGAIVLDIIIQFLNEKCGTFRTINGALTESGLMHHHIMQNLYTPSGPIEKCHRLKKVPSKLDFFRDYVFRSRPVIIENAISSWPAIKKWSTDYLKEQYGDKIVHIKLTPDGVFEGVESAKIWSDYREDWIPETVKSQLPYPDLVVVRPAMREIKFSEFLDFITSGNQTYSAYLEYSSIPYYMPTLQQDIFELSFIEGSLGMRHLNMWLSDGNTLGKLHFDPFDNLLCQVSGEKHVTLFDPHHNENLYEAHIPEAILTYSEKTGEFHRHKLLESTSMVMSPVDIEEPDLTRYPLFSDARRVQCSLRPGDVLFMPAFWWHEVRSQPDPEHRRNLAVNFWYEPVFMKEFPCPECRLQFNMNNRHLLSE